MYYTGQCGDAALLLLSFYIFSVILFSCTFCYGSYNSVSVVSQSLQLVPKSIPIWLWPLISGVSGADGVSGEKGEKGWPGYPGDLGQKGLPGGNSMQKGFKGDKGAEGNKVSRALQEAAPILIPQANENIYKMDRE